MRPIRTLLAISPALAASPAWADHGPGLRTEGMSPIVTALVWAGAAFLVGMAIVAIITVLSRRRRAAPPDG